MKEFINEAFRFQTLAGIKPINYLNEAVEVPSWLAGKLEDVHTKPGQGSIFAKSIDNVLKIAQDALDKEQNIDKIANSTGTLTISSPGIGYNLVLPIEKAKQLPGAQESETEKIEGPNKIKVPAITTTAPLTQFKTDELTIIVRPKKDEGGNILPNEYIVLSVFPGDPDIPRASEWNDKYAVIIPGGKEELKEEEEGKGYTAGYKDMELVFDNFPSAAINVDIENGIVTKVNADIEKEGIYSYDENSFATALKPFKDAGVQVDYTPWTSSGGDDNEGYFSIDASSLNNAIASKKITIKSDSEDPEEYLVLAESKLNELQYFHNGAEMNQIINYDDSDITDDLEALGQGSMDGQDFKPGQTYNIGGQKYKIEPQNDEFKLVLTEKLKIYVKEAKRFQELAGILNESQLNEKQPSSLDVTNKKAVLQFLANNGIDDNYFKSMGGKEIDGGSDEWLNVLSVLIGKHPYGNDVDVEDDRKISNFLITIDRLGIDFV
jgi:hypothetical protein